MRGNTLFYATSLCTDLYQNIYFADILPGVIEYAAQHCELKSLDENETEVLKQCLTFLRAMACKNEVVKEWYV